MRVLITGASGFLGQSLIKYLFGKNCEIFNLGSSEVKNSTHFLLKSPSDKKAINDAILEIKPDCVFHLAGLAIRDSDILSSFTVNTFFCDYLLQAIDSASLGYHTKIIIVGSAAEYGRIDSSQLPISESLAPNPPTVYGISKLAQTHTALAWQREGKALVIVRPFNIIGANMPDHLAIGSFVKQIKSMSANGVMRTGTLDSSRDFISVSDVVHLMWELIHIKKAYGETVNLCTGKATPIKDVLNYLIRLSGKKIQLISEKDRSIRGDTKIHYGDNKKLLELIGNYEFIPWKVTLSSVMNKNN